VTTLSAVPETRPQAVVVEGLTKSFRIPEERTHTLKETVLHPFKHRAHTRFDALTDASFDVREGEFFGIVGRNGSGKSTMLKCLAGIYKADAGAAWIRGRLSTFIELGVGFNMDLPARDNIRLNAVMLGLTSTEARRREEEIIDFAGLQQFQDLKIKNYSSGMLVRLGFSIMIHVDADVLLIDEVLAVGDAEFQQKCFDEFDRIRREGKTVLLVTHDMNAVDRYCDRAVLIEKGVVQSIGDPHTVGQEYLRLNFALSAEEASLRVGDNLEPEAGRWGDGNAEITKWWSEDATQTESVVLASRDLAFFNAHVYFHREATDPVFGVEVHNSRGQLVLHVSTIDEPAAGRTFQAGDEYVFRVSFQNFLAAGPYVATPYVAHRGQGQRWMDRREALAGFTVMSTAARTNAVIDVPAEFGLHRVTPASESSSAEQAPA
jgi:ABC-type polysaccharide/polyol phosphate transport system ATPase subunit